MRETREKRREREREREREIVKIHIFFETPGWMDSRRGRRSCQMRLPWRMPVSLRTYADALIGRYNKSISISVYFLGLNRTDIEK